MQARSLDPATHAAPAKTPTPPRAWLWLGLGVALLVTAHLRFGIGALAFIAPLPSLRYLRRTHGWASRLALSAALMVGWSLAVLKIVTPP